MDRSTFIKIDRNIERWRWYKDGNTSRVFIHLLLNANVVDGIFKGFTVHRGCMITSYGKIAKRLGMSVSQVRTAFKHLVDTGEIETKALHDFQLVKIVNYSRYQENLVVNSKKYKGHKEDPQERKEAKEPIGYRYEPFINEYGERSVRKIEL